MKRVYDNCCGIDVHKKLMVACFVHDRKREIREFGATTKELLELADWLAEGGCQMVAMKVPPPSGMDRRSVAAWIVACELYSG